MRIDVIIIVNAMTKFYLKELIEQINSKNIVVITLYKNKLLEDIKFIKNVSVYEFPYLTLKEQLMQLKRIKKDHISSILEEKKNKEINFYIAQPNHILTNYIYFNLSKDKRISVHQIPDGIANYLKVETKKYFFKMCFKKICSSMIGLKYKIYLGDYLGEKFNNFKTYYYIGDSPNLSKEKNKKQIILEKKQLEVRGLNKIIFLGQGVFPNKSYYKMLEDVFYDLSNKYEKVYYKAHPAEKETKELQNILKKYKIFFYKERKNSEFLIDEFKNYAAFVSTSYLTLRLVAGNDVKLISYIDKRNLKIAFSHFNENNIKKIIELYEKLNVEIRYLNGVEK
ncbi:MAG: polysialyltransferase family glycosyltransferase [Cetobacterium sp.]